jgi:Ca-activated chloride channel family protein
MNPVAFGSLASLWLLGLVVPVVILYFLKLKRPRLIVPSLVLWRRVTRDSRVNSPFQRFKRNLLLLLQILALLLLVLAALQPIWRRREGRITRQAILVDCSASMAALDRPGGGSRLAAARALVSEMIDGLPRGHELCLVSFGRTARRRCDFTDNKAELRQAVAAIEIEDVASNAEDALRMAQALAQTAAFDEVVLLSDGNFPARAHFQLPFRVNYHRVSPPGPNYGITSLSASRSPEGRWDVFVQVEGSADADATVTVEVLQDGEVVGTEHVSVAAAKSESIMFEVPGESSSSLKVRLLPEGFDSLQSDNSAFLELARTRPLNVYVAPDMAAYRHALAVLKDLSLGGGENPGAALSRYDLVISDRADDLALPGTTRLYVGVIPDDVAPLLTVTDEGTSVVDWDRGTPLLRHVELAETTILERVAAAEEVTEDDFENLGYQVVVHGVGGPLLLRRPPGESLDLYLLFHTDRSTLPYRVGFPVMVSNLVRLAMAQAGLAEAQAERTGVLPRLALTPAARYEVTGPDGDGRVVETDSLGVLAGVPAPRVGLYTVSSGGEAEARVGASLLSPLETTLVSAETVQFDEDLSVVASSDRRLADQALWPIALMLAFVTLLGEWWYFHRRPGGLPR